MATDNYHRLTTDRNWTHEQFREWLAATIMSQLFKSTQTSVSRPGKRGIGDTPIPVAETRCGHDSSVVGTGAAQPLRCPVRPPEKVPGNGGADPKR
jgi:hypothetical protein